MGVSTHVINSLFDFLLHLSKLYFCFRLDECGCMEMNIDLVGAMGITESTVADPMLCQSQCYATDGCKSFTVVASTGMCRLWGGDGSGG